MARTLQDINDTLHLFPSEFMAIQLIMLKYTKVVCAFSNQAYWLCKLYCNSLQLLIFVLYCLFMARGTLEGGEIAIFGE